MAEKHESPKIERILPPPTPHKADEGVKPQVDRGAPQAPDRRAGAQKPTIGSFLDTLGKLPKGGTDSGSSSKK